MQALKSALKKLEIKCFLSNESDNLDSYLEFHAGAGGTESQDWAEILQRMYLRWAESQDNCKVCLLYTSDAADE